MFKKVFMIVVICLIFTELYSDEDKKVKLGITVGLFYSNQDLVTKESTIEAQVDSISLFLMNMKFGTLLRGGYNFNPLLSLGLESGILFNSYHQNFPLRVYGKLGTTNINLKFISGISIIRESGYDNNGIETVIMGSSFEYGARLELFHVYFELLKSHAISSNLLDSTKISFGYSLFFPKIR